MAQKNLFTALFLVAVSLSFYCLSASATQRGTFLRECDIDQGRCIWSADYLVVGTGAGGAPLIRRLSDDFHYSVIGFEAGLNHDDDPIVSVGTNMLAIGPNANVYNWQMKASFDNYFFKTADISIGRMLGGSTSHNGMMYARPSVQYADSVWKAAGGDAWNSTAVQKAFHQMENYTVSYSTDGPVASTRGTNGPLDVRRPMTGPKKGSNSLAYRLANLTAAASGIPMTDDYNDFSSPRKAFGSFPRYQMFQQGPSGKRESSSTAFLPPSVMNKDGTGVGNRQLRVLFKSTVTRVIFQDNKAVGVEFIRNGVQQYARARKEVILAASIFTSQILQNSGIGPAALLEANGIEVVVDNPNVGEHLTNHVSITLPVKYNLTEAPGATTGEADSIYTGGAFLPHWKADGPITDMTLLDGPRQFQLIWFSTLFPGFYGLFISPLLPKTEGYERIQSNDPLQVPLHNEQTFSNADDLNDLADFLYHFVQNTLFDYMHAQDSNYDIGWSRWTSVDQVKGTIQAAAGKALHYSSHTRMSTSAATGVVDYAGRVFGVEGLRVSGAAALPSAVDATPAAAAMLVGWRLADFIIEDRAN